MRNLSKKPVFEKGKASWLSELPPVIKQSNSTIHNSTKMTPLPVSKKVNEELFFPSLQDRRVRQKPKYVLGHLVPTLDIKKMFSKGDMTNYSYELYTKTEVTH